MPIQTDLNGKVTKVINFDRKAQYSRTITTASGIAAGALSAENFISEGDEWAYGAFDTLVIANLDTVDMALLLDRSPDNMIPIKAGVTLGMDNLNFRNFQLKNLSAANAHTAGKILITYQNTFRKPNE